MKKSLYIYVFLFIGTALFASCGNNSEDPDDSPLVINIPEDDDECCSYDDELAMRRLFADYQEVDDLSGIIFDKYTIRVYARYATLRVGYTELLFAVEKTATNQHVKDIQISDFVPVMTMGAMGMKHSAPTANSFSKIDGLPVYKIWFAPLMASDENSFWELSLNYSVKGSVGKTENLRFNVVAQPSGNTWIKSFKLIDRTYYLTLVNAENFQTGINTIQAYISRTGENKVLPYYDASEEFVIEHTPTMPDMGNHSSPGNESLIRQESGIYEGRLNLSMTGLWNIHLVVKDKNGNIVAGGENDNSGYSNLYWTISI